MAQMKAVWNIYGIFMHRVIQERRSVICEVIVSVIVKKVQFNMCPFPNGYRDRAVWLHKHKSIVCAYKEKLLIGNLILISI